jgi:UDP-N-acetylmuramate: L-alanyl-gamma-D-glutamyl-meso-diaminopimelate ligase
MSDQLRAEGIDLVEGYGADQVALAPDLWVIGNVVTRGNPLMEAILDRGDRYISGPQWLAEHVLHGRWVLAVAGTHGKTTTTSILAWLLERAGLEPGFLVGGIPADFGVSARLGRAPFFVVEADEYDTAFFDKRSKFVHYRPRTLVLGNLEYDHADIFEDLRAIQRQFHHLVRTVPASGQIISRAGDAALEETIGMGAWTPIVRFGTTADDGADVVVEPAADGFVLREAGAVVADVRWQMPGAHNAENAAAAMLAARHAGVPLDFSAAALVGFRGVARRQELRGTAAGVTVYDDFAHHPTAIARTLAAMRPVPAEGRLVAVLEPRSNTMRLGVHAKALAPALASADLAFVHAPADLGWDAAGALAALGDLCVVEASLDRLLEQLVAALVSGDRVVIMSNGSFGGLHVRLLAALAERERRSCA